MVEAVRVEQLMADGSLVSSLGVDVPSFLSCFKQCTASSSRDVLHRTAPACALFPANLNYNLSLLAVSVLCCCRNWRRIVGQKL